MSCPKLARLHDGDNEGTWYHHSSLQGRSNPPRGRQCSQWLPSRFSNHISLNNQLSLSRVSLPPFYTFCNLSIAHLALIGHLAFQIPVRFLCRSHLHLPLFAPPATPRSGIVLFTMRLCSSDPTVSPRLTAWQRVGP